MKAKQLSTTSISTACLRSMLPFPLRPRHQRPEPPLAEVQGAEQQPFLNAGRQVEEIQYLGLRARVTPSWRAAPLRKMGLTPRGTRLSPELPVVHFRCGPVTRSTFQERSDFDCPCHCWRGLRIYLFRSHQSFTFVAAR